MLAGLPCSYEVAYCVIRIVNVTDGQINIDGVDVRHIGLRALRSKLSLVPQDSTLFMGTLRENL